jgi:hypothetical protein
MKIFILIFFSFSLYAQEIPTLQSTMSLVAFHQLEAMRSLHGFYYYIKYENPQAVYLIARETTPIEREMIARISDFLRRGFFATEEIFDMIRMYNYECALMGIQARAIIEELMRDGTF